MVHTDIRDYQVTLVPENYETEVALILLHLQSVTQHYYEDNPGWTSFMQFLWLLIVMRTVTEGLARVDEDTTWEPEPGFDQIRDKLAIEYDDHAGDKTDSIIDEFREINEALVKRGVVDKESLLILLYSLTSTMSYMDQITGFLAMEIDSLGSMRHN